VAEVPGCAEGLGGAVVEDSAVEGAAAVADDAGEEVPGPAGVHAARPSSAPAAITAAAARLCSPKTFTGTFLHGVDAGFSLQFSQSVGLGLKSWDRTRRKQQIKLPVMQ
jgi:hypothetical protein